MTPTEKVTDTLIAAGAISSPLWADVVAIAAQVGEIWVWAGGITLVTLRVAKAWKDYNRND